MTNESDLKKDNENVELNLSNCIAGERFRTVEDWSRLKFIKKLDLNSNDLSSLPSDMEQIAPSLEILFLSENKFDVIPEVVGKLNRLRMISFRGNRLSELSSSNLPKSLVWLILTNNRISRIDSNIKELTRLRKLMLSHNQLSQIPPEIGGCRDLELVRLSNNQIISELPEEFLSLPKLAWLSLAGNPIIHTPQINEKEIPKSSVSIDRSNILGKGASGTVYSGTYAGKNVAVKIFKQQSMGSDGNPEDEAAINTLVDHPLVVSAIGVFLSDEKSQHEGMVMELLKGAAAIGEVPSFDTVTRDAGPTVYATGLSRENILSIIWNVVTALEHIHSSLGVSNGDVYPHNILVCEQGIARLSDWGASFIYSLDHKFAEMFERIEVLAFGRLVQDLFDWHLNLAVPDATEPSGFLGRTRGIPMEGGPLQDLMKTILQLDQNARPLFKEIKETIEVMDDFKNIKDAEVRLTNVKND